MKKQSKKRVFKGKIVKANPFDNLPEGIQLPYMYQGNIWKMRILLFENGQPPQIGKEKYHTVPGGSEALFNADELRPEIPAMLVDEELDAQFITQEAKGNIVAVATGGMKTARSERWVNILKTVPFVLISFPISTNGNEATRWWIEHLPNAKAWPIPEAFNNIGAMNASGVSIQHWIQSGIIAEQGKDTTQ